eukprot:1182027-Prorocentrum_minimum.AAC.5
MPGGVFFLSRVVREPHLALEGGGGGLYVGHEAAEVVAELLVDQLQRLRVAARPHVQLDRLFVLGLVFLGGGQEGVSRGSGGGQQGVRRGSGGGQEGERGAKRRPLTFGNYHRSLSETTTAHFRKRPQLTFGNDHRSDEQHGESVFWRRCPSTDHQ